VPYAAASVKSTLPVVAPPTHVEVKGLSPQTACAARTQPSHLPFEMFIVAPASVAVKVNAAVPLAPVVVAGLPPQNSIDPAIPPQIARTATLMSCETNVVAGSVHVVPVTALGFTASLARSFSGAAKNVVARERRVREVNVRENIICIVCNKTSVWETIKEWKEVSDCVSNTSSNYYQDDI